MIQSFLKYYPQIHNTCFVADNATIIGNVIIAEQSSIWFQAVIRADKEQIIIGKGTNIQDHVTLHTDPNYRLTIKDNVTIGHRAIVHGATIEDEVLIGMGATILNGAIIGKHSIIGANALIPEGCVIPEGSIVVGCPGKIIKQITPQQIQMIQQNAKEYQQLAEIYKNQINN